LTHFFNKLLPHLQELGIESIMLGEARSRGRWRVEYMRLRR